MKTSENHRRLVPVVPEYQGACIASLVPALISALPAAQRDVFSRENPSVAHWLPEELRDVEQIVLLVLDGLGFHQLVAHKKHAPQLSSGVKMFLTSVAPSTTACALTSIATGLPPAVHGIIGYRMLHTNSIMNVLQWRLDGKDAREILPPREFQRHPSFRGLANPVPVVTRSDYGATGFTSAHLGDAAITGWHTSSAIAIDIGSLVREQAPFVFAYYDGIDRVAHVHGLSDHYVAELRHVDRLVCDILFELPRKAALVVTSDHGEIDVGLRSEVLPAEIMEGVARISGEGRFRWLHAKRGAASDISAAAQAIYSDVAWVKTKESAIDDGWFGGEPIPSVGQRLGDVVLAPFEPTAFLDPADTGEQRLVARHGSLTEDEMHVPLAVFFGDR